MLLAGEIISVQMLYHDCGSSWPRESGPASNVYHHIGSIAEKAKKNNKSEGIHSKNGDQLLFLNKEN